MGKIAGKTILHIEDDLDFAKIAEHLITSLDGNYALVEHPDELLKVLPTIEPDLILLDLNFYAPDKQGKLSLERGEVVLEFRQISPKLQSIPVLVCTSENEAGTAISTEIKGADGFIAKPVQMEALQNKIESLL